jgi:lactoylglutathione lyase
MKIFLFILIAVTALSCSRNTVPTPPTQPKAILNHMAFYVTNLKTSTDFYRQIIGLDTIPNPFNDGKHTWFQIDTHGHLHLIEGSKERSAHDKNTHLCFSVLSMEAVTQQLEQARIPFENWGGEKQKYNVRVDGIKQIYLQDPDGYWIEINDDRKLK